MVLLCCLDVVFFFFPIMRTHGCYVNRKSLLVFLVWPELWALISMFSFLLLDLISSFGKCFCFLSNPLIPHALWACSLEVDLSKELTSPSKPVVEEGVEAVQVCSTVTSSLLLFLKFILFFFISWESYHYQASDSTLQKWKPAPTRREQEKWNRATKAATGGSVSIFLIG